MDLEEDKEKSMKTLQKHQEGFTAIKETFIKASHSVTFLHGVNSLSVIPWILASHPIFSAMYLAMQVAVLVASFVHRALGLSRCFQ